MKIELKIKSWGKQNHDFDLEAILGKVAILTSMLESEPALAINNGISTIWVHLEMKVVVTYLLLNVNWMVSFTTCVWDQGGYVISDRHEFPQQ